MEDKQVSDWDNLWGFDYNVDHGLVVPATWCREVKAVGDEMQFKLNASQEALGKVFNKLADEQKKLKDIRDLAEKALEGYASINSAYWDRTEALEKILEMLDK